MTKEQERLIRMAKSIASSWADRNEDADAIVSLLAEALDAEPVRGVSKTLGPSPSQTVRIRRVKGGSK